MAHELVRDLAAGAERCDPVAARVPQTLALRMTLQGKREEHMESCAEERTGPGVSQAEAGVADETSAVG